MGMKYIRDTYGVPAKRGMRVDFVQFTGETVSGTITGTYCAHLVVKHGGEKRPFYYHPTWNISYYDDMGNKIWPKPLTKPEVPDTLIDKI
jgi:hypothetical protein